MLCSIGNLPEREDQGRWQDRQSRKHRVGRPLEEQNQCHVRETVLQKVGQFESTVLLFFPLIVRISCGSVLKTAPARPSPPGI